MNVSCVNKCNCSLDVQIDTVREEENKCVSAEIIIKFCLSVSAHILMSTNWRQFKHNFELCIG